MSRSGATYSRVPAADARTQGKKAKAGEIDFDRLFDAMKASRQKLQAYREFRLKAVRHMAGKHYSDAASPQHIPVPLIAKYVRVTTRSLVPRCPQVTLASDSGENIPAVSAMEEWVNRWLHQTNFGDKARRVVVDSLFCVGAMKVALGSPADTLASNYGAKTGEPFAEAVDLDDLVIDPRCRDFHLARFVGHRYRVPLEEAKKLAFFDKKARKELDDAKAPGGTRLNQEGDDRIETLGGWDTFAEEFEDMAELWEIYVPSKRRILTFASSAGGVPAAGTKPLRDQEWVGPDCGPIHFLPMGTLPGNLMPLAPVMENYDLSEAINFLYRKLISQAARQKQVLPVKGGQLDDAKRLQQTSDGEMFPCDNAETMRAVDYGGPNQVNAAFTAHLSDQFNRQSGNLDLQAGAAPQADTATQEKILAGNSSAGVADMRDAATHFFSGVLESVCWYWWYHPQKVMTGTRTVPGLASPVRRDLKPGPSAPGLARNGPFEDLNCQVNPYSLQYKTPAERAATLLGLFEKLSPASQMMSAQGVTMDFAYLIKRLAEYEHEPDLERLFTVADPQTPKPQGGDGGGQGMPATTSRNYTRTSVGQDTQANRTNDMMNAARKAASDSTGE